MAETQFGIPPVTVAGKQFNVLRIVRTLIGTAVIVQQLFLVEAVDMQKVLLGLLLFDHTLLTVWKNGK